MAEVNANQMTVLRQRPGKRLRRYSRQRRCQPGRPQKVLLPFKAERPPVLRFHLVDMVLPHDAAMNRTVRNTDGSALSDTAYSRNIPHAEARTYDDGI